MAGWTLEVLRSLWRDDEANHLGPLVHLHRARWLPKLAQSGGALIAIGGHTEAAARRAGRLGASFYPAADSEHVAAQLAVMRAAAVEAGRRADATEITPGGGTVPDLDTVSATRTSASADSSRPPRL